MENKKINNAHIFLLSMNIQNSKIASVVVTYNRKKLLSQCILAIEKQSYIPHTIFIIDNASTDGTDVCVYEHGYCNAIKDGVVYKYVRLSENIGGAGGFYVGLKMAYESAEAFDGFWVMDDDGCPDPNQLERLATYMGTYHYISPLVLDKENHKKMAFGKLGVDDLPSLTENGIMIGRANPFNGILFSRQLITEVGYPEKDMFIWGDEWQYHLRAKKSGYIPITVVDAIHYHPKDKQPRVVTRGDKSIVFPIQDWKLYCYCRNMVYYQFVNNSFIDVAKYAYKVMMDYFYFLYKNKYSIGKYWIVFCAVRDGLFKNLRRLRKYKIE